MTMLHRNYSIRHELDNGNLYVVNRRGDTLGMLWWRPTGRFTVLLEHLEVYPQYQGRGIGTAMQAAFVELLPKLFPKAKYLTAQATSQGSRSPADSSLGQATQPTRPQGSSTKISPELDPHEEPGFYPLLRASGTRQ